eukprot:scaffold1462_cov260-Pinguiococcus_pyrenoidosus.AAC.4
MSAQGLADRDESPCASSHVLACLMVAGLGEKAWTALSATKAPRKRSIGGVGSGGPWRKRATEGESDVTVCLCPSSRLSTFCPVHGNISPLRRLFFRARNTIFYSDLLTELAVIGREYSWEIMHLPALVLLHR